MSVAECKSPVVKRIRENGRVKWRWSIAEEKERETEKAAMDGRLSCRPSVVSSGAWWEVAQRGPEWRVAQQKVNNTCIVP